MHAKPIKLFTLVELAIWLLPAFLALCHGERALRGPQTDVAPSVLASEGLP